MAETPSPCSPRGTAFPRAARLTRPVEFERALRRADRRLQAGPLRASIVFNRMHGARLGLVVGKRAIARAHARNRVKRIIRETFRQCRRDLPAVDLVVRVVAPVSAPELRDHLRSLFEALRGMTPPDRGGDEGGGPS